MNWDAIGASAELLAAMGVIATLLFLAIQIRTSTRVTRAATFDSILAEYRTHLRHSVSDLGIVAKGWADISALTNEDRLTFHAFHVNEGLFVENIIQQYQNGNVEFSQLEPWLDSYSGMIRTPGGEEWWLIQSRFFSPNLVKTMNDHVEKTRSQPTILSHEYLFPDPVGFRSVGE